MASAATGVLKTYNHWAAHNTRFTSGFSSSVQLLSTGRWGFSFSPPTMPLDRMLTKNQIYRHRGGERRCPGLALAYLVRVEFFGNASTGLYAGIYHCENLCNPRSSDQNSCQTISHLCVSNANPPRTTQEARSPF